MLTINWLSVTAIVLVVIQSLCQSVRSGWKARETLSIMLWILTAFRCSASWATDDHKNLSPQKRLWLILETLSDWCGYPVVLSERFQCKPQIRVQQDESHRSAYGPCRFGLDRRLCCWSGLMQMMADQWAPDRNWWTPAGLSDVSSLSLLCYSVFTTVKPSELCYVHSSVSPVGYCF